MPQLAGDPKEMERRLGGTLAKLKGDEVLARNYAGVVRRCCPGARACSGARLLGGKSLVPPPTLTSVNIKPK